MHWLLNPNYLHELAGGHRGPHRLGGRRIGLAE